MTRPKLLSPQILAVGKMMEAHCAKVNGYSVYEKGWSDERIAAEVSNPLPERPISVHSVANQRRQNFGNFEKLAPSGSPYDVNKHKKLQEQIDELKREQSWQREDRERDKATINALTNYVIMLGPYVSKLGVQPYRPPPGKVISTPPAGSEQHA